MTEAVFRSDVLVQLRDQMGNEDTIAEVAKVSTEGAGSRTTASNNGLVRYLVREKHGVPLEAVVFRFYIEAPIFTTRQILKHRIASINEESGRYRELQGVFYVPSEDRMLVQIGKTGDYNFEPGNPQQYEALKFVLESTAKASWSNYETLLETGISKEVARMHLPFNTYSSMYLTINLRSLLNFIGKRKEWENATTVSHAQAEIGMVTEQIVAFVKEATPTVWDAFEKGGYQQV